MNTSIRFIMSGLPRTIFAAAILAIALGVNDTLDLPSLLVRFTSAIVNFVMAGAILGSVLADADAMDMTDIAWIASMLVLSWIAIAAALTIYSRRVRRTFKPGTSGRRVGAAAWIIVVVLVVLNPIRGGGLMLPIVLFVLFCVTALLGTLMRRYQPVRSFVAMGFWIGLLLLPATGASILFADGETALSQRQLVHSRVGFVWIPFLLATMSFHISTSPSAKTQLRRHQWIGPRHLPPHRRRFGIDPRFVWSTRAVQHDARARRVCDCRRRRSRETPAPLPEAGVRSARAVGSGATVADRGLRPCSLWRPWFSIL